MKRFITPLVLSAIIFSASSCTKKEEKIRALHYEIETKLPSTIGVNLNYKKDSIELTGCFPTEAMYSEAITMIKKKKLKLKDNTKICTNLFDTPIIDSLNIANDSIIVNSSSIKKDSITILTDSIKTDSLQKEIKPQA